MKLTRRAATPSIERVTNDLPIDVSRALTVFRRWARKRFRGRLIKLALFGSFARGEGRLHESDVDIVLVVERLSNRELQQIVEQGAIISSQFNVLLSPVAFPADRYQQMQRDERLFVQEVENDGVAL